MEFIKVLMNLISIDTSVPPGRNYPAVIEYLESLFEEAGCQTEKVLIPRECTKGLRGERVNLLAHRREPGKPRLIFYTHVDVVPAKGWPAFEPRQVDGIVYGRGAADMKGSIVALLWTLNKIRKEKLNYDLSVMVTTDEEMLGKQASQLEYLGQFLEPLQGSYIWDLDSSFGYVEIAGLGDIQMKIKVRGKAAHSALPHLGVNAIEKTFFLERVLLQLQKKVEKKESAISAVPDSGLEKMKSGLNITQTQGGNGVNTIPDECTLSIDRRLIPEESLEVAEKELRSIISAVRRQRKMKGVGFEIKNIVRIPGFVTPTDDPEVEKLAKVLKEVTGETGKYGTMGSFELPILASKWGAKVFGLGVARPDSNTHGVNEFVRLRDIKNLAKIIGKFLTGD